MMGVFNSSRRRQAAMHPDPRNHRFSRGGCRFCRPRPIGKTTSAIPRSIPSWALPLQRGSGIAVTQVEADYNSDAAVLAYMPDASTPEFSGKTFIFKPATVSEYKSLFTTSSVTSITTSDHATTVGRHLYGSSSSIAPGVSTVYSWDADYWLYSNLNYGTQENADVVNCSWVGTSPTNAEYFTQRLDRSVNQYDYVAVVAENNGATMPYMLNQNYNGITVGLTNGSHSHGTTTIDGAGPHEARYRGARNIHQLCHADGQFGIGLAAGEG